MKLALLISYLCLGLSMAIIGGIMYTSFPTTQPVHVARSR